MPTIFSIFQLPISFFSLLQPIRFKFHFPCLALKKRLSICQPHFSLFQLLNSFFSITKFLFFFCFCFFLLQSIRYKFYFPCFTPKKLLSICQPCLSLFQLLNSFFFFWRKCTFSPYILAFFHFSPYILILPLLVSKPINACYFRPFCQSTDGNSWGGSRRN